MSAKAAWCALFASAFLGCSHAKPSVNPFVHGRPTEYRLPADRERSAALSTFVASVRDAQARAVPAPRHPFPTIESRDPGLARELARLKADPTAENHRRVAAAYGKVGVTDLAHQHLTEAIRLLPLDASAYDARARIVRDWGFPQLALGDAHRAVYFARRSASAHNTLGTVLYRLRDYAGARRQYEAAVALNARASYALANLCTLDLAEGRSRDAVDSCGRALFIDPTLGLAQAGLAAANALAAAENSENRDGRDE